MLSDRHDGLPGLGASARVAAALTYRCARLPLLGYLLLVVAESAMPVAAAWLTKLLLERLVDGGPVTGIAVALGLTGVVLAAAPAGTGYLGNEIGRRSGLGAIAGLFAATERFTGLARFEDPHFIDRLRLAQQATGAGSRLATGVFGMARGFLTLAGFIGSLAVLSPAMTGIVLVTAIPALLMQLRLSRQRASMNLDLGPAERREFFYSQLLTGLNAAKELRLFGLGPFMRGRMLAERRETDSARKLLDGKEMRVEAALAGLSALAAAGGLLWAIASVRQGGLSIGDIMIFVAAVAGVQASLHTLVSSVAGAHADLLIFQHYAAVTGAEPDQPAPVSPKPLPALRSGIELRDVWFRYSDDHPWILRGVSMRLPVSSSVAIVGLNGAGKSTLVKLLCRFYDPVRGQILWDGVDIREVPVGELRRRISAVFQDHMNYDLSAGENIGVGEVSAIGDLPRIRQAAQLAGVAGKLAALPDGYDTMLSRIFFGGPERAAGVVLSGGQWQRVALARAFFRTGRDLAILDEPSSGLDAEAEHELHTRMREHRGDGITMLISHRLNTVREADHIFVIQDGRVTEHGDHDSLIAAAGSYARLFELQASGYHPAHRQPPFCVAALELPADQIPLPHEPRQCQQAGEQPDLVDAGDDAGGRAAPSLDRQRD